MTSATWSASVADLFAQGGQSGCLGSDQAGVLTQTLAANGGSQINKLCFELQPNNLVKLSVRYNWSASRTAAPDAIAYREFLRFNVSLRFSGSVDVLGGAANMPLAHTFDDNFTFTFCPGDAESCPATDPASYPPVKRVTQQISG
jgi:hypothetical protein